MLAGGFAAKDLKLEKEGGAKIEIFEALGPLETVSVSLFCFSWLVNR